MIRRIVREEQEANGFINYSNILKVGDVILTRNKSKMKVVKIDKNDPNRCIYIKETYFDHDRNQLGYTLVPQSQEYILTKFGKWDNKRNTDLDIIDIIKK